MSMSYRHMIQARGHPITRRSKPQRNFGDEPWADSPCGEARASEFDGAATQSRERLEGGDYEQNGKGRDRSTDASGLGEGGKDKKHPREKERTPECKRSGNCGLDAGQLIIRRGEVSVGGGNRVWRCREPTPQN